MEERRPRSSVQIARQEHRSSRTGRYEEFFPCDNCGKSCGEGYCTHEACGSGDGPGFVLCDREECRSKLENVPLQDIQFTIAKRMVRRKKNRLELKPGDEVRYIGRIGP